MTKWALVIVDCLRYDHADAFAFPELTLLNRVVSVSNWTLPAVTTMVTGLHPLEHRAGCRPIEGNAVNSMKRWPSTLRGWEGPTILRDGDAVLYEIPVLALAIKPPRPGFWHRCKETPAHKVAQGHLDADGLVVHVKGGHSPWRYVGLPNREIDYNDVGLYRLELEELAPELETLVTALVGSFDTVVVVADHGRYFEGYTHSNHGCEFGLEVLHVPLWYGGIVWEPIFEQQSKPVPDELYDLRAVTELLMRRMPTSRQVAFSTSPGHGTYDRVAMTYLAGERLRCDVVETSEPFDLYEGDEGWTQV